MKSAQSNSNIEQPVEFPDGRSFDSMAVQNITQQWTDRLMKKRESEFTKPAECSVFCGTWNVNAKKQEGSLNDWLLPTKDRADIYAIGFQEIVDLNAVNVALNSNNTQQRAQFWEDKIKECLDTSGVKYVMIGDKYMVGLLLCIYVKESLVSKVRDIRATSLGVGIMGMMGNKGGVSVRLSLYDSTICFVCSHLAAHRENVVGRNNDFKNIMERSLFYSDVSSENNNYSNDNDVEVNTSVGSIIMPRQGASRYVDLDLAIYEHDIIIWFGDLNYRIDDSLTTEEVFQKIESKDLESLRQRDQLNIERSKGKVFQGFSEGVLNFLPTYKYQPGTDNYETRAEKKLRAPAWCDRILWKTLSGNNNDALRLIDYRRSSLLPSDHKPVSGQFICSLKQVVDEKEKNVFRELITRLNKYPSKSLPVAEISGLKIHLDKVFYEEKRSSVITIKNTGESILHWRFVPKLEEKLVAKRWVQLSETCGLLLPGEISTVELTVFVDRKTAQILNSGKDLLQDLLIIRIEKSIDYYVDVKCNYERSCFGMSLEELVTTLQPVATTVLPTANTDAYLATLQPIDDANKLSIPKELWRLVDALWSSNALKEKDLFNAVADPNEVVAVRRALDQGSEFGICSPHAIAECLTSFLSSLPKPLLPPDLYPSAEIESSSMKMISRKFLEDLPPLNYNVFVYILSFFREVLAEESYNRCNPQQLSNVCIQCMTSAIPPASEAAKDGGHGELPDENDEFYEFMSNEEREKRIAKQSYLQDLIIYLLTTNTL